MHSGLASTASSRVARSSASVQTNMIRDIQLVKSQIGEDKRSLRFIRIHRSRVTLNGLIASAKETFSDKDLSGKGLVVQFRDAVGDFVTLRDDMEIGLLDLVSLLDQTVLKFLPVDENGMYLKDDCDDVGASSKMTLPTGSGANELQTVLRRLGDVENIAKQLTKSLDALRGVVLKDLAEVVYRFDVKPVEPISQPSDDKPVGSICQASETSSVQGSSQDIPSVSELRELFGQPSKSKSAAQSADGSSTSTPTPGISRKPKSTRPGSGTVFARFTAALDNPVGPDKMTLLGKKAGDRMFVKQQILLRAIQEAESVADESGEEICQFAKTVLLATAEDLGGCCLRTVLQDLHKVSGRDVTQAWCTFLGKHWLKILHFWAVSRWPTSGLE